jgi:hypothetical protein
MKKIFIIPILIVLLLTSCEQVINVDLGTAAPRLVIDAGIDWEKGTTGNNQVIKLSTTTSYYSNIIPKVSGATVFVTNSSNAVFNFIETVPNSGSYVCSNFVPVMSETYVLTVIHAGQTYTASEKMIAVPDITRTVQRVTNEGTADQIEVEFYFKDNGLEDNNYMSRYIAPGIVIPVFGTYEDRFQQGNEMSSTYSNDKLKAGNIINFTLYGISRQNYNYMNLFLSITGGGGLFATPPATLRGNIVNQTNESNFCFGYFRVNEIVKLDYTIK